MGTMFKKGYKAVREEKKRQDENREKMGKSLWRFFLGKDGDEATVRFLTEEPINFYEHTVKTVRNGKEHYDNVICTKDLDCGCSLCDDGDRPSFKGAYLIFDRRPITIKDQKTGKDKTINGQLRLYVQGARVLSQLDRLSQRYGLTNRDYTITRTGSGTSTTYMFDRDDDKSKLTESEIRNMLPEKLREQFDGTQESLYAILQDQLEMLVKGESDDEDDDENEDEEETSPAYERSRNLVGVDDDDDDEDDDSDDDEEEEAPRHHSAKKLSGKSAKPMFKSNKSKKKHPRENSVKSLTAKKK